MSYWNDDRLDELKRGASARFSSNQIGEMMGKSKSSIISACRRYKIKLDPNPENVARRISAALKKQWDSGQRDHLRAGKR